MLKYFINSCLALLLVSFAAKAQTPQEMAANQAKQMTQALMQLDYRTFVSFTHPLIIRKTGGREKYVKTVIATGENLKKANIYITNISLGSPYGFVAANGKVFVLLPQVVTLQAPKGKLVQESQLLGISHDAGKVWFFIDLGPLKETQLWELFPELKGKIKFPEKKKAVIIQD